MNYNYGFMQGKGGGKSFALDIFGNIEDDYQVISHNFKYIVGRFQRVNNYNFYSGLYGML